MGKKGRRRKKHGKTVSLIFLGVALFRLLNAFLIQTQFDPDEYWQTLEPAYCETFPERGCAYTWEWTRRSEADSDDLVAGSLEGPVRSYVSVLPTYVFYQAVKAMGIDYPWVMRKGPQLLYAMLVAAPTDISVFFLVLDLTADSTAAFWALFVSLTSWFNAYALVRTYSNSLETVLFALSMGLVARELCGQRHSRTSAPLAFFLGGLAVASRVSALAAWVPLGMLLAVKQYTVLQQLLYPIFPCAICGLLGVGGSILVDRLFYGFWTVPLLGNFHFNVLEGLGYLYGTHPWYWYFALGLPAISGLSMPILLWNVLGDGPTYNEFLLWILIVVYTALHSISEHKEFRFLLPILPLICCITGTTLRRVLYGRSKWITRLTVLLFVLSNLVVFLYLGLFHQHAPIAVNKALVEEARQSTTTSSSNATTTSVLSVHYLMGCHSAPAYSHLHLPSSTITSFEVWHLDCSPSCRTTKTCESDAFQQDPVRFMRQAYGLRGGKNKCSSNNDGGDNNNQEGDNVVCIDYTGPTRPIPDYLVMFAKDVAVVLDILTKKLKMKETSRFAHGVTGARLGDSIMLGDYNDMPESETESTSETATWSPHASVQVNLNEMVLFQPQTK